MAHCLVIVSMLLTIICFGIIWFEHIWTDFYAWGPPFKVGTMVIKDWSRWWIFVTLLVIYQITRVYIEETSGREIERKHIREEKWTKMDVLFFACYNFYKWLGMILHLLIAVTRFDVWFLIAIVDTLFRAFMWNPTNGRSRRVFYSSTTSSF
jgi:hypothetical protein